MALLEWPGTTLEASDLLACIDRQCKAGWRAPAHKDDPPFEGQQCKWEGDKRLSMCAAHHDLIQDKTVRRLLFMRRTCSNRLWASEFTR
jgi:hypothetical protein